MEGVGSPLDAFSFVSSRAARAATEGYVELVKRAPRIYRTIQRNAERAGDGGPVRRLLSAYAARNFFVAFRGRPPSVAVCTHEFACSVMASYKRRYQPNLPIVAVITDYAVQPQWIYRNIDRYAVPTEEMRRELVDAGIRPSAVRVTGIPIGVDFARSTQDVGAMRHKLSLPADLPIVLLMGGGLGIGPLEELALALDRLSDRFGIVAITGKNVACEMRLRRIAADSNRFIRVLGFVENVHEYMAASTMLVSKPGGLTLAESLAMALPIVISNPLAGHEERNAAYFVENALAVRTFGVGESVAAIADLLRQPEHRNAVERRLRSAAQPHAAADIAAMITELDGREHQSLAG